MKTIVCFGDSNTWGANPHTGDRYAPHERWTGVLQAEIGRGYRVIEEGLNGRTTNLDDIIEPHRNGLAYLLPCLESHRPIDLVTVMLGGNDLKARFNRSGSDAAQAAALVAQTAANQLVGPGLTRPKVLLMISPPFVPLGKFGPLFGVDAIEKSHELARMIPLFASITGLPVLDLAALIEASPADGVHLDAEALPVIGRAVAERVRALIG